MQTSPRLNALLMAIALHPFALAGCGSSASGTAPPVETPPVISQAERFWIEPSQKVTIARGQAISIHAALQNSSDLFPQYQRGAQISWSSSNAGVASINSDGVLTGLAEGTTTVMATHRSSSSAIEVIVDGLMQSRSLVVGEGTRRYAVYTPSNVTTGTRTPLLVSAHGGGGNAIIQAATTQLNMLAHKQQIRIVYLEGSGTIQTFNAGVCCGFAQSAAIDDVAYVRAVLDDLQSRMNIDTTKVFATGFSNGGMLSHRLACALSDRISGIAAVGGASGQFDFDGNRYYECSPTRLIPILHIHATNDRNYPFTGGFGDGLSDTNFYPVAATINDWIARNNVTADATHEQVTATTTCRHYRQRLDINKPSAPVTLCIVDPKDVYDPSTQIVFGGGHSWPGGVRSPSETSDTPPTDFAANEYLWRLLAEQT